MTMTKIYVEQQANKDTPGGYAGLDAAGNPPILASGNPTVFLGDSITSITCDTVGDQRGAQSYAAWACLLSDSQITWSRNAGVAGDTAAQVLARVQTDVVAYAPKFCVLHVGANDAYIATTTLASYAASIKGIVGALRAARIRPILSTVMQRSDVGSNLVDQYNAWLKVYAKAQGLPLAPFCSTVIDPATGLTKPAYTADGLHPSAAGAQLLGQALATVAAGVMPLWTPPLAAHAQAWSVNQLANGLFLANSGGLATGWLKDQGAGTPSIVAGDGVTVLGNWQKIAENPHTAQTVVHGPVNTVVANPGDRLAFTGWFQSACSGADSAQVGLYWWPSSAASMPVFNFPGTVPPHRFYVETIAPAGNTGFGVYLTLPAGGGGNDFAQLAQPTVINLTALGIPSLL